MMKFASQPILDDFEVFLTFLNSREQTPLTNDGLELKWDDLFRLNEELHHKATWVTNRSRQYFYPELDFFFRVVLAGKLVRLYREEKKNHLKINWPAWDAYRSLNPTEQYFFLLETAWSQLDWGKLCSMRSFYAGDSIFKMFTIASQSAPGITFQQAPNQSGLLYEGETIHLTLAGKLVQVLGFLGFFELIPDRALTKKPDRYSFPYEALIVGEGSPLLLPILLQQRPYELWNWPHRKDMGEGEVPLGLTEEEYYVENPVEGYWEPRPPETLSIPQFLDAFRHLAEPGELSESLYQNPVVVSFVDGTYLFKVALNKNCYRTLAIRASDTLEELHLAIQDAFQFDNDHLYVFYPDGDSDSQEQYYHPEAEGLGPPFADQVKIGELGLYPGQQLLYVFDFGDNWHFYLSFLENNQAMTQPKTPVVIDSKGESPQQYPDWEEEE